MKLTKVKLPLTYKSINKAILILSHTFLIVNGHINLFPFNKGMC